jgi:hypothetical protein
MPRVFISYVREPGISESILAFSNMLRQNGIDCRIDQYEPSPPMGWQRWCEQQFADADFVLICCTPEYYRRAQSGSGTGGAWEVALIRSYVFTHIYHQTKCIPVVPSEDHVGAIPEFLQSYQHYVLARSSDVSELYRVLTNQPATIPVPVGRTQLLPSATPVMAAPFAGASTSAPATPQTQTGWSEVMHDPGALGPGGRPRPAEWWK